LPSEGGEFLHNVKETSAYIEIEHNLKFLGGLFSVTWYLGHDGDTAR